VTHGVGRVHADGAQPDPAASRREASQGLGVPLPGETVEQLDLLGEWDRVRAEHGLVPIMGEAGKIYYKHVDDLSTLDMRSRVAAEWATVEWLKERVVRRREGADAPLIPRHLP
jgi:hypothetical protein